MSRILCLTITLSLLFLSRAQIDLTQWELFTHNVQEISFSGSTMMIIPSILEQGRTQLLYYRQTTKDFVNGLSLSYPSRIKAGPGNEEFYLEPNNVIPKNFLWYRAKGTTNNWGVSPWAVNPIEFAATQDNHIYFVIRNDPPIPEGGVVHKFNRQTQAITTMSFKAVRLAVDPTNNQPWVIKGITGNIYYHDGTDWVRVPGNANEITFGSTNTPFIVSQDPTPEGFAIKKWNRATASWETIPGIGGIKVAVDTDKDIYVVTNTNQVYRLKNGKASVFCPPTLCNTASNGAYCQPDRLQCINCPAETVLVTSPLSCPACPGGCKVCSAPNVCTTCKPGYVLNSANLCESPCAKTPSTPFYYPDDGSCRSTCGVPILDPTILYLQCRACPNNCLTCSSTTTCTKCASTHYLSPIATCLASCDAPMVSSADTAGNRLCKGPCANDGSKPYYYSSDNTCKATCAVPTCLI